MNSQARSAKERSVAWNTWMGTAPASTLGCEEPFVKCNKAITQWHRDATLGWVWGKGIAVGQSQSSQHLCAHRQREQPELFLPPCSSLIYLANFKSADGFTLENLISGSIDPWIRRSRSAGWTASQSPSPRLAYPAGPCLSFDSTNSCPIFSFSHSSFRVLIFRGFTFPRFGFSFFSF